RATEERSREESVRQLLEQVQTVRNWTANRLQAQVVAGEFNTSADDQGFAGEKTLPRLKQSGFESAFDGLEPAKRVTLPGNANRPDATTDYLFTRDVGGVLNPMIYEASLTEHWVLTSDLDLDVEKPQPIPAAPVIAETPPVKTVPKENIPANQTNEATAAKSVPIVSASFESDTGRDGALRRPRIPHAGQRDVPTQQLQVNWRLIGTCAGAVIVLFLSGLLLGIRLRRKKPKALLPTPRTSPRLAPISGPERIVVVPTTTNQAPFVRIEVEGVTQTQTQSQSQTWQSQPDTAQPHVEQIPGPLREGLIRQLSHWLKSKFVQRMISDRAELMKTQQTAALKVLAMDERLSKVERQIQERNREYEQRIDVLLKELEVAREENRELIRAKIAVLRAEMEKNARSAPAKPKD
ncbi:MAG TPA: hypothetical protein VFB72_11830, partial [Verrucomicrobiae bacterium]|nr:hypothetical protein [Verrucomicrobiae bacterium]